MGAAYLTEALGDNQSISTVDLSRNALGFRSIHALLCACRPKNLMVLTNGNYVFEEILNSVSHGIAFIVSVVGANILISDAVDIYRTDYHFWACVLYSFAPMFLFLSSCLYHSFFMLPSRTFILFVLAPYSPFLFHIYCCLLIDCYCFVIFSMFLCNYIECCCVRLL